MPENQDKVGTGDPRLDDNANGDSRIPGTPGYSSEAAFRHRNFNQADVPEIRDVQIVPGPIEERDEPTLQPYHEPMWDATRHRSE